MHRLSADAHLLAGLYEQETALMLSEAFKNAVTVPKPNNRDLWDKTLNKIYLIVENLNSIDPIAYCTIEEEAKKILRQYE